MIRISPMARKALWLGSVACVLAAVSAHPRHFPGSHSPFGFAADAATVVGVEESSFSCGELEYGYYADQSLDCKVFHICMPNTSPTGRRREAYKFSFFCPNQTRFSQDSRTCISEEQAYPCHSAHLLYDLNSAFAQPGDGDGEPTSPRAKSSSLSSAAGRSSGLSSATGRSSSLSSAAGGSSSLSSAAGESSGLSSTAGRSSGLSSAAGRSSSLSSAAGGSSGLSSAAGESSGLSSAAGGSSGLSSAAGESSGLSSAARGSFGLSSAAEGSSGLSSAVGGSSGLSSATGGSSGLSSAVRALGQKSTSIPSTGQRQVRPTVSDLAFQDRESSDDETSVTVSLSKDSLASVSSGRFKIDDSRMLDDSSFTAEIDHSHSISGSSKIDNDNDFILTTQSPSIQERKTNRLNQNASKRFKGSHLNDNSRQLNDNANEQIDIKQIHRATEQKNNSPASKGLENSSNIPRGRKVSGGSEGIVVPGNSLNDDIEEPVAEPEPEPEPSAKTGDGEDAKENGSPSSKSSGVDEDGALTSKVQSSARLTPFTPVNLTPRKNNDVSTPLLVGHRPSLSLNAAAISGTQVLPSGQKSTKPFGTPSVGNDLIDGKQSPPDGTVPSFQDPQKLPQNVLGNIRGNFHQIGFQIIKHDQSTNLQGGNNPLVLSPLAKAQKLPASLSLPSLDEPPKREGSRTSQQNLPVSSVIQGRGLPNFNLNNGLYSNRQSPVGQTNLGGEVSDATSSGARQPSNRRGNRLYGDNSGTSRNSGSNSVTNRDSGANSVTSHNSSPNKLSSESNRNAYLPQAVSSRAGTSTANVASFQVSDRTAPKLSNDGNAEKKVIKVNHSSNQNAVPPPPLFESHGGKIKIFEAQPESEESDNEKFSPLKQTTQSPSLSVSSNKSYLPTQKSGQPTQTSGRIPGFSAGVRRIKGKLIEGSAVPRTEQTTHKLGKTTQKIDHKVSTLSPATVTSKPASNNFSPTSRTSIQAQTETPAFNRARGRGRGGTVSQSTVVDALKINDNAGAVSREATSTSLTDSTQQSRAAAGRTNRGRNQTAGRGRGNNQKTTQNPNLQTPSQRPASRNLRGRGNHNSLRGLNQLKPKEFETSKGHEVKTTHDLEILLDEDLDAATASLLAGIQPPQKFRHKKDSSSHEAPVVASEDDGEAFADEPSIQPLVKSPPITGTVIPQRLFNPRQKTPSNRRATPGSVTLGTVGSITTNNRNGEVNLNFLPTTTTTTTTPRPRTTRLPRSTTERSTTTRRPVNDKRGSVKFTPSPYLDLSWLGPTIRNKITNHFKRVGHSARGRQNSEISNAISKPPTRGESESDFNSINSRKGSDSVGFSLSKSKKISLLKTPHQTTPIPILNSPDPAVAHDLDVAGTTTKAPNLFGFSNRRRTRNHRVKLRVNPVNDNAETKENADASESSTAEGLPEKQGVPPRSVIDNQSEPRTLPDEDDVIGGIITNVKNGRSESNQPTTSTTKPIKNQVGEKPSTVDASTDLSSKKLAPEDQLLAAENVSEGPSKVELSPETVEPTTPGEARSVATSDVGETELNIETTRAQSQSLSRIAGIRKKIKMENSNLNIKTEGSNSNLNIKAEDSNSDLKIKTEDSNSDLKVKTEDSNSDLTENESLNTSTDDVGNLSNTRSRDRSGKRRKVVRLNKRPASVVDGSSTSTDALTENPIAPKEELSTQTSKRKTTRRISQRRTQKNDLKSGVGQAKHEDEKNEKLDNVSEPTRAVQKSAENLTKENETPERKDDKILLPARGTKRQKIPLPTRRESLSGNADEVTDEISKKNVLKKSSRNSGQRISSSETDNKNPAQKETLQDRKPLVISGIRSRTQSRTRLTLPKAQATSNSTIPVSSTSERSQNLPTSNAPVVHSLRSRRISTRRRLITSVPTTTAETTVDNKSENTKITDEKGLKKQEESSRTAVTGSSTEGTTAPTSKSSFIRRKSRTRFTTAIPESEKDVEKIPTDDNSISRAASTTEITPVSSTSAANNVRRRFRTRVNNSAVESSKKSESSKSAKKSETPESPQKIETLDSPKKSDTLESSKKSETPESQKNSETPESPKKSETSESHKKFETPEAPKISDTSEAPKNSETSNSLDVSTTTSRPTNEASSTAATPAKENRRRFRTRVSAIKPDQLTTSPNSETGDNSLDASRDIQTNSSPHNGRGYRRTSRRRLISDKIPTGDDNNETDEDKKLSERADAQPARQSVKAEVEREDGTQNSERNKENDENKTTKLPSVISSTTTTTTTTPVPVDFASLFKIDTGNRELEDEIQTISESQNTRKTAVRRRKINTVAGAEPKTSKYFGVKNNEKDSIDLEGSSTKADDEQNTPVTNEKVEHSEQTSLRRTTTTEIEEENSHAATPNVGESKEISFQNKISNSGLEIQSEVGKSTSQPPRRSFARNRRLVKKVKLSKTEVPNESLNNVYETLRSARSNTTVKSNELSIPGLEPGLKLRVVGTSVKKSVSTSSTALSPPENPESSSQPREEVAISQISDSPYEKPTKTRRKFASRRPVNREVDFSEDLSVPQAAESRAFRRTIIRRKVKNES